MPQVKPAILLAIAALGSLALTSCQSTLQSASGETQYLTGIYAPPTQKPSTAFEDTISYWQGDGVPGAPSVKIDLSEQKAYFYKGGQLVGVSRISSGNESHRTPTGSFKVTQKNIDHRSNLYGEIVDAYGNVVNNDATNGKDPIPPGGKFVGASMPFFMRFNNAVGMHAGYLPGYPASHGCVRMPRWMAKNFYNHVEYGTPVTVVP